MWVPLLGVAQQRFPRSSGPHLGKPTGGARWGVPEMMNPKLKTIHLDRFRVLPF